LALFLYKTKSILFSYLIMIRLLPNTDSQTINIIPRDKTSLSSINLTITEDGTNKSETLTDLTASDNGNFVSVSLASTILKAESAYYLQFSKSGELWYRDKAYVTSQTNDEVIHTLNENKYTQYGAGTEDEYIVI
jgi:hypothetical protein